ncbi:hypothetical protein EXN66_Car003835 [Channa argus]|uniref:Uncharacterized protein n=1 Tax=Channa argus TaxID=215402 RepID=A0A6G1PD78_CHAAH|nr:hypothetical protein EXN66_Car003835 [Channa argus]
MSAAQHGHTQYGSTPGTEHTIIIEAGALVRLGNELKSFSYTLQREVGPSGLCPGSSSVFISSCSFYEPKCSLSVTFIQIKLIDLTQDQILSSLYVGNDKNRKYCCV